MNGQPRKLLAQASRNGYFFVLDRTNGEHLLTTPFIKTNWSSGLDAKGQPMRNKSKDPQPDGTLVSPASGGASNWPPPSFNPNTGMLYVSAMRSYSVYYLTDLDDKPEGWGGLDRGVYTECYLQAIDYKTGKVAWSHPWAPGTFGLSGWLSTAGNLLFGGDTAGNVVAFNPRNGDLLWHARLNMNISNGPITYELDGVQYMVVGVNDMLVAFTLP